MKGTGKLIPRRRLYLLPAHLRLKHEYCFFLHDEVVRLLKEYEKAKAHFVGIKFKSPAEAKRFQAAASNTDTISAMRACGYEAKAKNVIMNQITMALVSDSLHHIYEALRCAEKKKIVVTSNLLRKPLTDSIL